MASIAAISLAGRPRARRIRTMCRIMRRGPCAALGAVAEDEVAGLLADHDRRRVGVGGWHPRHDRGIAHPQPVEAAHSQVRLDHRHRARPHRAGAGRVVVGLAGAKGVLGQLLVGRRAPGRACARPGGRARSAGCRRISRAMRRPCERHRAVVGVGPVVGVDQRRVGGIGRSAAGPCRASAAAGRRS